MSADRLDRRLDRDLHDHGEHEGHRLHGDHAGRGVARGEHGERLRLDVREHVRPLDRLRAEGRRCRRSTRARHICRRTRPSPVRRGRGHLRPRRTRNRSCGTPDRVEEAARVRVGDLRHRRGVRAVEDEGERADGLGLAPRRRLVDVDGFVRSAVARHAGRRACARRPRTPQAPTVHAQARTLRAAYEASPVTGPLDGAGPHHHVERSRRAAGADDACSARSRSTAGGRARRRARRHRGARRWTPGHHAAEGAAQGGQDDRLLAREEVAQSGGRVARLPGKGQECPGPAQAGSSLGGGLDPSWKFLAFSWKSGHGCPPSGAYRLDTIVTRPTATAPGPVGQSCRRSQDRIAGRRALPSRPMAGDGIAVNAVAALAVDVQTRRSQPSTAARSR